MLGLGEGGIGALFSASFAPETPSNLADGYSDFIDLVLDYLGSDEMLAAMSELLASGVDIEVIRSAILASLMERFLDLWEGDAIMFERVVDEMIDFILSRVSQQANLAPADMQLAMAAE